MYLPVKRGIPFDIIVLDGKDILFLAPSKNKLYKSIRDLNKLRIDNSVRKFFIPKTVAEKLIRQKEEQKNEGDSRT